MDRFVGAGRIAMSLLLIASLAAAVAAEPPEVILSRLPVGEYQPQVVTDNAERVHMIYAAGDPAAADVYYIHAEANGDLSEPIRVNSQPGSALPIGTVRGAQLAVDGEGRPHVRRPYPRSPLAPSHVPDEHDRPAA